MTILLAVAAIIGVAVLYMLLAPRLRTMARDRSYRRREYGGLGEEPPPDDNPWIPDWIEFHPARFFAVVAVLAVALIALSGCMTTVPAGHRGVLLTWGKVEDRILGEGLNFKMPFVQKVELMTVQIQKTESTESTASNDLQEVSTTVAVNYRLDPKAVNWIYRELRKDYADRVIKPNIEESLKAATAQYTAEELITKRALMKATFGDIIDDRLAVFKIEVVAVSLTDFQFSASFSDAIEAKVTAEQEALQAKNVLVRIQYEAQQKIIQAEAEKNATIITAEADARQVEIAAQADAFRVEVAAKAEAFRVTTEANATAKAIQVITSQMTPEYAQYLFLQQWSGLFPTTMLGDIEDLGLIIQTP